MKGLILIVGLALLGFVALDCRFNASTNQKPDTTESSPAIEPAGDETINFNGVSFTYDPRTLGKVKAEEVAEIRLERPEDKPDSVAPHHVHFSFDTQKPYWEGFVDVYPIKDFPLMYEVSKSSVKAKEKEIEALRKSLKDKNFRLNGQIPYIPYIDAEQDFQTNLKLSRFKNGNGIFFVTYLSTEAALVSNDHLRYIFEGLTDDGKHYVLAEIPVSVGFLPEESPEDFEGYKRTFLFDDVPNPHKIQSRYKDYILSITNRLEKLPSDVFRPDLKSLEALISSLKIETD